MDSSQSKHLPPSARKLRRSRARGQVARSRDAAHLAVLGTGAALLFLGGGWALRHLCAALARQWTFDALALAAVEGMGRSLWLMGMDALVLVLAVALLVAPAALLAALACGGWVWSAQVLQPQFSRLSPLAGCARLVSRQQLFAALKMVALTLLLAAAGWHVLHAHGMDAAALARQELSAALPAAGHWLLRGMLPLLGVLALLAAVDVPLQAWLHRTRLRMSHEEVRQEHKEVDGNPHIKGRLRARQRQASERASVRAVERADFVLVNPEHYAVALRYDQKNMAAPEVVAKGVDLVAARIRALAVQHGVVQVESPALARALYAHAPLNQPIPAALYTAVAQVLAYVWRLQAAQRQGLAAAQLVPPQPAVPEHLDPKRGGA